MAASFRVSLTEAKLISKIVGRAIREVYQNDSVDFLDVEMDVTACHANGCPLDLEKLLSAPAFDFAHDIAGIRANLDRTTGELTNCFLPRCSEPVVA